MDISPRQERLLATHAYQELVSEFEGKLLPPNHPISRHVRRVVSRILESSKLGSLKDEPVHQAQDAFGFGTPGDTWSDGSGAGTHQANPQGEPFPLVPPFLIPPNKCFF
jgi:hypothetical protein